LKSKRGEGRRCFVEDEKLAVDPKSFRTGGCPARWRVRARPWGGEDRGPLASQRQKSAHPCKAPTAVWDLESHGFLPIPPPILLRTCPPACLLPLPLIPLSPSSALSLPRPRRSLTGPSLHTARPLRLSLPQHPILRTMPSHQPVAGMQAIDPEYVQQPSSMATVSEPNRNAKYDPKKPHITETPLTKANWYKHVNWLNVSTVPHETIPDPGLLTPPTGHLHHRHSPRWLRRGFLDAATMEDGGLGGHLLLLDWSGNHGRVPSSLGPQVIQCRPDPQRLPCPCWRRCCRGLHPLVVP